MVLHWYSLPYTLVLGWVACRTTSKISGIGACERSWGDVKQIKSGKRSHIGGESVEKRAILYTSAKVQEARIRATEMEKIDARGPGAMFCDDDMNFNHQLEAFGVDTTELQQPASQRIFRAWVEDWEKEYVKKDDPVAEAALLEKYKGLVFYDPDEKSTFTICSRNMEFHRGRGGGWHVIGISADENVDDEPFDLELVCTMIGDTEQADGVEVIARESEEAGGSTGSEEGSDN